MEYWSENFPAGRSPRKELQGARPTPLKINKESLKIKKPPLAPQPLQAAPPPRQPIIIYTVSPKIFHTTPGDFMNLVQRLTGDSSSSTSISNASSSQYTDLIVISDSPNDDMRSSTTACTGAIISPAARYATIEKAARSASHQHHHHHPDPADFSDEMGIVGESIEIGQGVLGRAAGMIRSSILSPGPASLSGIPSSFFSPPSSDPNSSFNFLHDFMSPALIQGNRQYFAEGSFMPSPSNFDSPLVFSSPTPSIDLFYNFMY